MKSVPITTDSCEEVQVRDMGKGHRATPIGSDGRFRTPYGHSTMPKKESNVIDKKANALFNIAAACKLAEFPPHKEPDGDEDAEGKEPPAPHSEAAEGHEPAPHAPPPMGGPPMGGPPPHGGGDPAQVLCQALCQMGLPDEAISHILAQVLQMSGAGQPPQHAGPPMGGPPAGPMGM